MLLSPVYVSQRRRALLFFLFFGKIFFSIGCCWISIQQRHYKRTAAAFYFRGWKGSWRVPFEKKTLNVKACSRLAGSTAAVTLTGHILNDVRGGKKKDEALRRRFSAASQHLLHRGREGRKILTSERHWSVQEQTNNYRLCFGFIKHRRTKKN